MKAAFHYVFDMIPLWAAIHKDEDDIFDPSSFNFPHYFNGSFTMPNRLFTGEFSTVSSSEGRALAAELETKVGPILFCFKWSTWFMSICCIWTCYILYMYKVIEWVEHRWPHSAHWSALLWRVCTSWKLPLCNNVADCGNGGTKHY